MAATWGMTPRVAIEAIRLLLHPPPGLEAADSVLDEITVIVDKVDVVQAVLPPDNQPHLPTVKDIVRAVARRCHCTPEEVYSNDRHKNVAYARKIAMWILRTELKLSFPKTAVSMGRTDHTTACSAVKAMRHLMADDEATRRLVATILADLAMPRADEEAA